MDHLLKKLASSQGRRDEEPNLSLARELAKNKDTKAIRDLIQLLGTSSRAIQSDIIKVLYEIGGIEPKLISAYAKDFINILDSTDNRLQWGAMMALNHIVLEEPETIFTHLSKLVKTAENGSVITMDNLIEILIKLCYFPEYHHDAFELINEQLQTSKENQFPMYAERTLLVIDRGNKKKFLSTLKERVGNIEKDSKRKRVEKVIKRAEQI